MGHLFENNLTEFYEYLLLKPLTKIYSAKKKSPTNETTEFSNLLIDKFAIHSLSFFHLSNGIVERKKSNEIVKMTGFDLFTVNSTFRTIMESYATFNNIYIEPKSKEEIEFRFLLWKLDGLFDKAKFEINETDFKDAKKKLEADKVILAETIQKLETCKFYNSLNKNELNKIYKPESTRVNWRFTINEIGIVKPLKIVELIKHTCRTRAFINNYRYTSTHTHTNYLAVEHFKQTRGIPISDNYVNPIIKLAIYITCLIICDICEFDKNALNEYKKLPKQVSEYITGIRNAIKEN